MSYTRRTELTCTQADLTTYADKVLLANELLAVVKTSGRRDIYYGDGTTPISGLSPSVSYDELNALKTAAETAKTGAEVARDAAVTAKSGAETAQTAAESARDTAAASAAAASATATAAAASAVSELRGDLSEYTGLFNGYDFEKGYITTKSVGIAMDWTVQSSTSTFYAHVIIDAKKGEQYKLNGTPYDNSGVRPYCIVDSNDRCVYRHDESAVMSDYVVTIPCDGKFVVNFNARYDYSIVDTLYPSAKEKLIDHENRIYNLENKTPIIKFSQLPIYLQETLSYRPLGTLDKPYICFTTDDGAIELATKTIPFFKNGYGSYTWSGLPCTFSLYPNSAVFDGGANQETVIDAIQNHGCELAMHGEDEWTTFTETGLSNYFDIADAFFKNIGLTPKSAVCPTHCISRMVKAVAGGRYGILRTGYNGKYKSTVGATSTDGGADHFYKWYCSGAKSNVLGISSIQIREIDSFSKTDSSGKEVGHKAILDYAKANNLMVVYYFHDWDMDTTHRTVADPSAVHDDYYYGVMADIVNYARNNGFAFVTLGQIPRCGCLDWNGRPLLNTH